MLRYSKSIDVEIASHVTHVVNRLSNLHIFILVFTIKIFIEMFLKILHVSFL